MRRHDLTDREWARLAPRLPPQKPAHGRPAKDHRTMINALLWLDRTGAPWRDLPERYGPWQSVAMGCSQPTSFVSSAPGA